MPNEAAGETKKAICRAFTKVVKASRLDGSIDPKAFFMMMNTNFAMLHREGSLDLGPLWEALATSHPPEVLMGVFLKFAESAQQIGLVPLLPPVVEALTADERERELQLFTPGQEVLGVVTGESGSFPSIDALPVLSDSAIVGLELSTGDLKPIIPEAVQRQITQHVVHAVKVAPVGQSVDAHQLAFVVDSNFADLFDGTQFDFNPVLGGLREIGTFRDEDVYVAIVRLEQKLHQMGYVLAPVSLDVDPNRVTELLEEAEQREKLAAQEAANAVAQTRRTADVPDVAPSVPDGDKNEPVKETRKDASLAKWSIKKRPLSKKARLIRYATLTAAAAALGGLAFITNPNRTISSDDFVTTIPLASAELRAGGLQGVLDEAAWWKVPFEARSERIEAFRKQTAAEGMARNLQIRDAKNRVVVSATNDGRIIAANFFEFGNEDGSIPDDQLERMMANLPATVRTAIRTRKEREEKKQKKKEKMEQEKAGN